METKIVMQYKRSKPAWVCWNCEMENDLTDHNCYFCRAARSDAKILKPGVEERMLNTTPYVKRRDEAEHSAVRAGYAPKGSVSHTSETKKYGWVPVLIWGIVLVVLVLIIIAVSNM